MVSPDDTFKEKYLKKTERELVIKCIGTDNALEREEISLDMNRRLVEEIRDFNKNSSKLTWLSIGLAVILGFIASIQVIILLR